jgi:hypothetical protein
MRSEEKALKKTPNGTSRTGIDNASAFKDAVNLNNLDDWHEFHQAVLK